MDDPEMRRRRRLNRPIQLGGSRYGPVRLDGTGESDRQESPPDSN